MEPAPGEPWLPDLCRLGRLATMLGVAELVVCVIALAPSADAEWTAARFASASAFALWLALTVSVVLCVARRPLSRLRPWVGGTAAVLVAALISATGAALVFAVDRGLSYGLVPDSMQLSRFVGGSAAIATLIVAVVLRYLYAVDGWQAQVRASSRAEADALQARIKPHFLFNSMNTIALLVRRDAVVAERAVLDLSDLFRAALIAGEGESTLAEEVELAERYLSIEQLRLGDRLQVRWRRNEPLPWQLKLPRLVLQPLVENAVLHGVSRLPAGGTIDIELSVRPDGLHLSVHNPAPPPRERDTMVDARATEGRGGTGHAQRSIAHRLAYAFGPRARVQGRWHEGYYLAELRIPL
ncbi:histidine kinase [Lysobacter sp. A6]|uniref:Histidine kinase n=1 Tax=Noviluteimonas lactosilytica TaxID=2888523 RepID=A0ABS8JH29_9GAMM|nr:histidine kinase [Lysobacter lactosilyticus]MCC8362909.1 histidine kinase [Lysobacter lactosilyticus]